MPEESSVAKLLEAVARSLIGREEVRAWESHIYAPPGRTVLWLRVPSDVRGRIIGSRGRLISAIRNLFSAIGAREGRQIIVQLDESD